MPPLYLFIFFWLICPNLTCTAKRSTESLAFEQMIEDSYKGLWYPLSNKTLPYEGFKIKNGLLFRDNQDDIPYTGWYTQFDTGKTVRFLSSFMDGKRQGYFAEWDENGVLRLSGEYFDGEKDGVHIEMDEKGNKTSERNYIIGKLHGESNFWYENGQMKLASTFEYGLIMEAKGWLSNGDPCPYTKVEDGVGVIFNFGEGFLEQLLQSQSTQTLGDAKSDSNQTTVNNFKELKIEP